MRSYLSMMRRYLDFEGRTRRRDFLRFAGIVLCLFLLAIVLDYVVFGRSAEQAGPLFLVVVLVHIAPGIAACARRLHDTDRSARWLWLILSGVGLVPLGFWLLSPGDPEPNRFGPPLRLKRRILVL